jgi:hypothetical protein
VSMDSGNEFLEMMGQTPAKQVDGAPGAVQNSEKEEAPRNAFETPKFRPISMSMMPKAAAAPSKPQVLHALDPRPDLTEDHRLWVAVLMVANRIAGKELDTLESMGEDRQTWETAAGTLHGLRCYGARLERRHNGTFKLNYKPVVQNIANDRDCGTDEAERYVLETWLNPYKVQIKVLFDRTLQLAREGRSVRA